MATQYDITLFATHHITTPGTLWKTGEISGHITPQNLKLLQTAISTKQDIEVTQYFSYITNFHTSFGKDQWEEPSPYNGSAETLTMESSSWEMETITSFTPTKEQIKTQQTFQKNKQKLLNTFLKKQQQKQQTLLNKLNTKKEMEEQNLKISNQLSNNNTLTGFNTPQSISIAKLFS